MLNPSMNDAARAPSLSGATTIVSTIEIARRRADVFDFVSNAALWPQWHPATRAVREVPMRPLREGETLVESIAAAGHRFDARWTVRVCEAPARWVIETDTPRGAARVGYRLVEAGAGRCRFERTLEYRSKGAFWSRLDGNVTRWLLTRQSARALRNLRRVLEG
jgi:uncharacterized protein YndB with AHSA1/START domain